jgi:hypothetical protein
MRLAVLATCLAILVPAAADAAIPRQSKEPAKVEKQIQLADYYSGKKHCRKVGSATVCN